jgi:hypothetical protein
MRTLVLGAVVLLGFGAGACATGGGSGRYIATRAEGATLEVHNDHLQDVNIYAVRAGTRFRLGTVLSNTTETFTVPPAMLMPGDFRLLADPIGSARTFLTDPLLVQPGQVIEFNVQNYLNLSTYSVW